ncbi:conserved hypothetical protein [Psychromonas ingrahamii 37]|uniref:Cation transporter n=1 Tax=Psychromonas ingrahamii (strain DSM 17664 / CCUG 51855 / 37) TaxID=357804 RepID=A1SVC7_PSYIN|nr:hypothetical protein [Psychromonas ingrahamii]ABM03442.1 conserved hypothetical protein [Psychromonas ingrahamii 37]
MNDLKHRVGVKEVNLVIRKLQLKGLTEFNQEKIIFEIDQALGIENVTLDIKDGLLKIAYDVTHINLDTIKHLVVKHGAEFSGGWWNHFKTGYYKFVDQNMIENSKHKPSCCSRPPAQSIKHK